MFDKLATEANKHASVEPQTRDFVVGTSLCGDEVHRANDHVHW